MPSVLDRLIDPDSHSGARTGYDLRQMTDAVRADLEELLNTRQSASEVPPECTETRHSIVGYGLPDLSAINAASAQQCDEVGRLIEALVTHFEPRLRRVRVRMVKGPDEASRTIRFHIDAALNVDPAPEVGFETILELTTGQATIRPSES
jgi:type VI secretion system protein ImpF